MQWERTFEFSVPVSNAWEAFNDHSEPTGWNNVFVGDPYRGGGTVAVELLESEPEQLLRWAETEGEDRVEMAVTFEETATGSRITITRSGFGEGDDWVVRHSGRLLGWEHVMRDFAAYVEHGVRLARLIRPRSAYGMAGIDRSGGFQVLSVVDGGFAAEAGLIPGDVVVSLAGVAVYGRHDLWQLQSLFEPGDGVAHRVHPRQRGPHRPRPDVAALEVGDDPRGLRRMMGAGIGSRDTRGEP
ncbi:MAG: hypothetical protein GEU80_08055 [Dehalococcoidia bacterium]|nr:hypothetical protein [Dehalococcoidia bacterium]